MTVHWTVICIRLTLRFATGESSGGRPSATLYVNSVLLYYLPPTSLKYLIRRALTCKGQRLFVPRNCQNHATPDPPHERGRNKGEIN